MKSVSPSPYAALQSGFAHHLGIFQRSLVSGENHEHLHGVKGKKGLTLHDAQGKLRSHCWKFQSQTGDDGGDMIHRTLSFNLRDDDDLSDPPLSSTTWTTHRRHSQHESGVFEDVVNILARMMKRRP